MKNVKTGQNLKIKNGQQEKRGEVSLGLPRRLEPGKNNRHIEYLENTGIIGNICKNNGNIEYLE